MLNLDGSVINKLLVEVWTFMDDLERVAEWQPYLVELRQDPVDAIGAEMER